jgi:hypothetical protein
MAKATVSELVVLIGEAVMRARDVAGDKVFDIHIFLQDWPTQERGVELSTVHCDQSYIAYDLRDEYAAAEEALRAELPRDVFALSYDESLYGSDDAAFEAEMETAVW